MLDKEDQKCTQELLQMHIRGICNMIYSIKSLCNKQTNNTQLGVRILLRIIKVCNFQQRTTKVKKPKKASERGKHVMRMKRVKEYSRYMCAWENKA